MKFYKTKVKSKKIKVILILSFIFYLLSLASTNAQIVKEFKTFRDTTYVNDKAAQTDTNTAHRNYMQANRDSINNVRNVINDSLDIAKGKIYDSTYTRIDSVITQIPLYASIHPIDNWYEQDITPSTTEPPEIIQMSRGVGRYENTHNVYSYCWLRKLGAKLTNDSLWGTVTVYLYKNGVEAAKIELGENVHIASKELAQNVVTFLPGDSIDVRYSYENYWGSHSSDLSVHVELAYPFTQVLATESFAGSRYTVTATANNGTVNHYKISSGAVTETNPTSYNLGDSVMIVAAGKDTSWRFGCWKGIQLYGTARTNDTAYFRITSPMNITARFQRGRWEGIRVVINQPDGNTSEGQRMKWMFVSGYDDDGLFSNWDQWVANGDSVHVTYYSNVEDAYKFCDSVGAEVLIEGTYNSRVRVQTLAQTYYPIQTFVPVGGRDSTDMDSTYRYWDSRHPIDEFPAAWTIGAIGYEQVVTPGEVPANTTTYDCEFLGYSPDADVSPGWWNAIVGNPTEPVQKYAAAWAAGLLMLSFDTFSSYYSTFADNGASDWYGYRTMMKMVCADNYDNDFHKWSNQNGYNAIDRGQTDDLTRLSNYILKTLQNKYYFRDKDPYYLR